MIKYDNFSFFYFWQVMFIKCWDLGSQKSISILIRIFFFLRIKEAESSSFYTNQHPEFKQKTGGYFFA